MKQIVLLVTTLLLGVVVASYAAQDVSVEEAKALFEVVCDRCHSKEDPENERLSPEEWREIVSRMIEYGAELDKEKAEIIIKYLSDTYPPE